jgi:hypothetical protein
MDTEHPTYLEVLWFSDGDVVHRETHQDLLSAKAAYALHMGMGHDPDLRRYTFHNSWRSESVVIGELMDRAEAKARLAAVQKAVAQRLAV